MLFAIPSVAIDWRPTFAEERPMYPSVHDAFVGFSKKFEGETTWLYLDVRGLVTVGIGNLVDSPAAALELDWQHPDGTPASDGEVTAAWQTVKNRQDLKTHGGGAFASLTALRATEESIRALIERKLVNYEGVIRNLFPEFDYWPADAQLAILSMSWALGPGFAVSGWPRFRMAALGQDWAAAATQCRTGDEATNPGIRPRNDANQRLFRNAAAVAAQDLDESALYYPATLAVPSDAA